MVIQAPWVHCLAYRTGHAGGIRSARPFVVSVPAVVSVVSVSAVCDQVDQGDQVVPAHQVDDIDEVHELDPVHQVDHKDECSKISLQKRHHKMAQPGCQKKPFSHFICY